MVVHKTGEVEFRVWITLPEGISHKFKLESKEEEMIFLPRSMIVAEVTERVCPRSTRTGCILEPETDNDEVSEEEVCQASGNSAERIDKLKSAPEESNTLEDGKNWRWVILDTCGFDTSLRLLEVLTLCGRLGVDEGGDMG